MHKLNLFQSNPLKSKSSYICKHWQQLIAELRCQKYARQCSISHRNFSFRTRELLLIYIIFQHFKYLIRIVRYFPFTLSKDCCIFRAPISINQRQIVLNVLIKPQNYPIHVTDSYNHSTSVIVRHYYSSKNFLHNLDRPIRFRLNKGADMGCMHWCPIYGIKYYFILYI